MHTSTRADVDDQLSLEGQRWLVVADCPFLPARGGGEREHEGMLDAARRAGVLGAVVLPTDEPVDVGHYEDVLGVPVVLTRRRTSPLMLVHPTKPYVVASRPAARGLARRVNQAAPRLTGIVITTYKSSGIGRVLARELQLPAVLRQQNRESLYHRSLADQLSGPRSLVYRWEAWRIARDERRLNAETWLAGTADISMADAEWRRRQGGRNVVHIPPFAVDASGVELAARPAISAPPRVLFVGALDVATNHAAVRWLLEQVWPLVAERTPEATLVIVGRRPTPDVVRDVGRASGVELHADVPDLRPFLEDATVAVNPAVTGSGVNIKIVEYMAAGLPVVSTSFSTRGLALRPEVDLRVSDEPDAFADALVSLLNDHEAAAELGLAGRRRVLDLLDARTNLARVAGLLGAAS